MGDADELLPALRTIRAAVPPMLRAGRGRDRQRRVGQRVLPARLGKTIDYGAAKAALREPVAMSLAQELGPRGIHVNCVSPGPVETDLWLGERRVAETIAAATGGDAAAVREQAYRGCSRRAASARRTRWRRSSRCSPRARTANVTGSNYVIDGGLVKTV